MDGRSGFLFSWKDLWATCSKREVERAYFEAESDGDAQRFDKLRKEYKRDITSLEQEIENYQEKIDAQHMKGLSVDQIIFMV